MLDVLPRSANFTEEESKKVKRISRRKKNGFPMQRDRDNMFRGNNNDCRVYVGNLPEDCRERDVEDLFYKYGAIADIRIKRGDASRGRSRGGPNLSYAFVQFDDSRDAEDAIRGRDGYDYDSNTLRVEFTRSSQNSNYRRRGGSSYQGRGRGRGVPPRRSSHRVNVKGLPPSGSWQDLKDHMREAGEVLYAEVFGDGSGIVEFAHSDDVRYALKNLDDTDFRSHEGENGRITVAEDSHGGRKSYSRSRSRSPRRDRQSRRPRSRSRSPSSSRSKSKSHSKSRSKSPVKSRSRSPRSRSPSRS